MTKQAPATNVSKGSLQNRVPKHVILGVSLVVIGIEEIALVNQGGQVACVTVSHKKGLITISAFMACEHYDIIARHVFAMFIFVY